MNNLSQFLNAGINRKQYLAYFALGLLLALILFIVTIYLTLLVMGTDAVERNPVIVTAIIFAYFFLVGLYFYCIKIKRLHGIGWTSDAFGAKLIPGGDILLDLLLFGKKNNSKTQSPSQNTTHAKYFSTFEQKLIVYAIFFLLNIAVLRLLGIGITYPAIGSSDFIYQIFSVLITYIYFYRIYIHITFDYLLTNSNHKNFIYLSVFNTKRWRKIDPSI